MKKYFLGSLVCLTMGLTFMGKEAKAIFVPPAGYYHSEVLGFSFDVGSAAGRILSTAVKYFLSDDTDMVAQLVWKDGEGCGGCYGGKPDASASLKFAAVLSDISVEDGVYRTDGTMGKDNLADTIGSKCVAALAQQRLDTTITDLASLADLSDKSWAIQYQSQRRSIQSLTDALNMKRLYNSIKDVATSIQDDYSDYSAAVSTVASKRLLLDQLLALKKRVIAARVRVRAQTMELNGADLKLITTSPDLTGVCAEPAPEPNPEGEEGGSGDNGSGENA